MQSIIHRLIKPAAFAVTTASMAALAGCSGGGGGQPAASELPIVQDNLDGLLQGMPLDTVQQALDAVLIDNLAANLPQEDAAALVEDVSNAMLELVEGPDAVLAALLTSGEMLAAGEVDPAAYRALLTDAGTQVVTQVQQAAFALVAALLNASSATPSQDVVNAVLALSTVTDIIDDPSAAADPTTLVAALDNAVIQLGELAASDLGIPDPAAGAVNTALGTVTDGFARVTELLVGLTSGDSGTPADQLINPIEGLLTGILGRVPNLQDVLAPLEERTGIDPVDATLGLVTQLTAATSPQGVINAAAGVIAPLIAAVGPLTGGLSPLLCGVLGPLGGLAACEQG